MERQLDVLRRIGIFPKENERELFLHIPDEAMRSVAHRLLMEEMRPGQFILIHPVSRWRFKCLSTEQMARLIERLCATGERVVISAGPDEQEKKMVEEILAKIPDLPVLNLAGKLELKGLAAWIQMSRALICVDSVPLHIASATKTPVVALFGPTSVQNWGPWKHPRAHVVSQRLPCQPCYQDGCGGSKMSDCLFTLSIEGIMAGLDHVLDSPKKRLNLHP